MIIIIKNVHKILIATSILFCISPAFAGLIWFDDPYLQIPIGGSGSTIMHLQLNASDYVDNSHEVKIKIYDSETGLPTDKLNLSVEGVSLTKDGVGSYKFSYYPTGAGIYNFTLILETNATNLPSVGDKFTVEAEDIVYILNYTDGHIVIDDKTIAARIFWPTVIPELLTVALMGVGLAVVLRYRYRS